jgi:hypothetical protein
VELPFTIVFEPPSQDELRAVLRMRGTWVAGLLVVLAIGTAIVLWSVGRAEAVGKDASVALQLASQPPGAGVWLDGRERGRTPLEVLVDPGAHDVLLKAPGALDGQYAVQVGADGAALDALLWRRQPTLNRLRPMLPGAVLSDVRVLSSGELALSMALPASRQVQAWRLEPRSGVLRPVVTDAAGKRLAVAPDGQRVAVLGYEVGPAPSGADLTGFSSEQPRIVWLVSATPSAPMVGWRAPLGPGEQLVDVSWSPTADSLLAVTTQALPGAALRSRLWFLEADALRAHEAVSLPSEVVPGSDVWSPDGQRVMFLARAGALNALCLLDRQGDFRYVADLDPTPVAPLAYPPATWSADSRRLLFVAPRQHPPGVVSGWLQPDARHALYLADVADPTPALIGDTDVDLAVWREDGQVIGLGRAGKDSVLDVRLLRASGGSQRLLELPLKPASSSIRYAAVWDPARGRLLVANPTASGGIDFWLVMLGLESEA